MGKFDARLQHWDCGLADRHNFWVANRGTRKSIWPFSVLKNHLLCIIAISCYMISGSPSIFYIYYNRGFRRINDSLSISLSFTSSRWLLLLLTDAVDWLLLIMGNKIILTAAMSSFKYSQYRPIAYSTYSSSNLYWEKIRSARMYEIKLWNMPWAL